MSKPNLNYKTRGNQSPQGKSKVFFTCAEEDFDQYFAKESDAILWTDNNIDCAIYVVRSASANLSVVSGHFLPQ